MLTFESCTNLIKNRETKKLANNTYLKKENGNFVVTFHETGIVTVLPDDSLILTTDGYRTKTTKIRLNEYIGNRIYQKNSIWYITGNNTSDDGIPFYDGITIDKNGNLLNVVDNSEKVSMCKKKLNSMVKKYIKGYIDWALKNGVNRSNGDCWYCLFGMGDSLDHVYSHLKENYYFGSFLDTAIKGGGFTPIWCSLIENQLQQGKTGDLKRVLTTYFKKNKSALLDYVMEDH